MSNKILETTNYDKFKTIRGNRSINRKYLSKLTESIQENNMLPQNPIIVNENMQILDGQHRLKVAKILGVSIYYTIVHTGSLPEVQRLNTNVRQWTTSDFLNSFIELGKKDYAELQDFSQKYGVSISNSMALLTGGFYSTVQSRRLGEFKDGSFKINHREYAETFVKRLYALSPFLEPSVVSDREFMKALEKALKAGISYDKLLEKLKASGLKIRRCAGFKEYIREIEDALSWKLNKIVRIPVRGQMKQFNQTATA